MKEENKSLRKHATCSFKQTLLPSYVKTYTLWSNAVIAEAEELQLARTGERLISGSRYEWVIHATETAAIHHDWAAGECHEVNFNLIYCLWADTKSIAWTHTFCITLVDANRQNRTFFKALKPTESQSSRHFLQPHWKQNHKVTDTFLTLKLAKT